jgi:hypothetical protein
LKLLSLLVDIVVQIVASVIRHLDDRCKAKTQPNNERLAVGAAFDLTSSKSAVLTG